MTLPINIALLLQRLEQGELINPSQINSKWAKVFVDDGLISVSNFGKTKKFKLKSSEYLTSYLLNNYSISDLDLYIKTLQNPKADRSDKTIASGNSKIKASKVFKGFLVNTFNDIYGTLNQNKISLKPLEGSFIFINDYENFHIPENINIIVVENFENFKYIEKQKDLFPNNNNIFIWRYQNNASAEWLAKLKNPYIHFGDFDFPGLNIYLNFKKLRPKSDNKFLIPENLEFYLEKYGSRERFLQQENYVKNINFEEHPEINPLVQLLKKHQKSLEQELFIKAPFP